MGPSTHSPKSTPREERGRGQTGAGTGWLTVVVAKRVGTSGEGVLDGARRDARRSRRQSGVKNVAVVDRDSLVEQMTRANNQLVRIESWPGPFPCMALF
jgi:hypothetical protein